MTPLHFEDLYRAEWDELESQLDADPRRAREPEERSRAGARRARGGAVSARLRAPGAGARALLSALPARSPRRLTADAHQVIYQRREFGVTRVEARHPVRLPARGARARRLCVDLGGAVRAAAVAGGLAGVRAAGADPVGDQRRGSRDVRGDVFRRGGVHRQRAARTPTGRCSASTSATTSASRSSVSRAACSRASAACSSCSSTASRSAPSPAISPSAGSATRSIRSSSRTARSS